MGCSAAVITVSDKGSRGERKDTSGPALCAILENDGWDVVYHSIVPDEAEMIKAELVKCSDELKTDLVLTTGGTGFSPRDITPEATKAVIERETPGIPEAMRTESMKITPNGCLSRSAAGIRGRTLIVNLPGSEKAAKENIFAVLKAIHHGVDMLRSEGSADCAQQPEIKKRAPSIDSWLKEAKECENADKCGMYLFHNGVVRRTAKSKARFNEDSGPVRWMEFSYDRKKVDEAVEKTYIMPGIFYVRVWLNEGRLEVGDDIMLVLVGGDIRPNVTNALQALLTDIKTKCVTETEMF